MLYLGIDVGTQGVRALAVDGTGKTAAARSVPFARLNIAQTPGWQEQSPDIWRIAVEDAVAGVTADLRAAGIDPADIAAISIDGTSGTIVALDADHRPLTNGIMYNDPRAKEEAGRVHAALPAPDEEANR